MIRNELLYEMQHNFPLTPYPFEVLAQRLGTTQEEVLLMVKQLKQEGVIRQTSAIFDTKRLGYHSCLVAFELSKEKIDHAVSMINQHPGVSHNYLRNHHFNLWFTLAVAPNSRLGIEKTVTLLKEAVSADDAIMLPTLKLFKISVKMDTTGTKAKREEVKKVIHKPLTITPELQTLIQHLQQDIPLIPEPFAPIKEAMNLSYEKLFSLAEVLKSHGVMRRFATILNHRKAGFLANAMSVWVAPKEEAEAIGEKLASFSAVSHCYLRPTYPNWHYNLFAMVHGKNQEECDAIIEEMAQETRLSEYKKLYSSVEFKKERLVYFSKRFEEWEEEAMKRYSQSAS